ncbi:MAG: hypothetical protein M1833_004730 [Piccolia ochrophora]|nr:MAG: hypothetical protein M1833_004730 [Piccolia ochrophora]
MEAVSARMAARDRFSALGDRGPSTLQRYIRSACDPSNYEPNLSLDLEVADLINSKKGNAPREAAVAIVNFVNHPNPNVSLLAITLLDICVKNCGYPFHLQISTKEFLNELVRKFPERPRPHPSRVQSKILEAIEEWRQTICQTSRYKEDLGFIRDMHRLLRDKGYVFPEVRREDAAVLNPSDNLKSADEMEEEERAAQSAKLQELIRRGGPEDLQQANKLMKVMAGFDTKHKTDYRAKAAEEVGKVQQKAKILEEMLQGYKQGDMVSEGDVFEELAHALQNAQPKIQKMCEEESDDQEAVAKLFEINDSIHRTLERFRLIKKGDVDGASKIPKGTLGTSTGVGKTADNELSLIDLGGGFDSGTNGAGSSTAQDSQRTEPLEDDLLGLSFQDTNYGQGGGIALAFGVGTSTTNQAPMPVQPQQGIAPPSAPAAPSAISPQPPQQSQPQLVKPDYSAFSALSSSQPTSQRSTPAPSLAQQQAHFHPPAPPSQAPADPFASITSPDPRQPSPFAFQHQLHAPPPSQSQEQPPPPSYQIQQQSNGVSPTPAAATATDNEEWTFASSLPDPAPLPTTSTKTLTTSTLTIALTVTRQPTPTNPSSLSLLFKLSNNTPQPVAELTFQTAVTKNYTLHLSPQTSRAISPLTRDGITQSMRLDGVERGSGNKVRMRWKVSYKLGSGAAGEAREEQGELDGLGVA